MRKSINILVLIIFVSINIGVSMLNFNFWYDLMPLCASTLVCFTVWQSNITIIRIGCLTSKIFWGVYAVISLAYFSIIMDIFIVVWTLILLYKAHKQSKNQISDNKNL